MLKVLNIIQVLILLIPFRLFAVTIEPGIYRGILEESSQYFAFEIQINSDNTYTYIDSKMKAVDIEKKCQGTFELEDYFFKGRLNCSEIDSFYDMLHIIDLRTLENSENVKMYIDKIFYQALNFNLEKMEETSNVSIIVNNVP